MPWEDRIEKATGITICYINIKMQPTNTFKNGTMTDKIKLALIAGGRSGERDVSLKGAEGVLAALNPDRYQINQYDPATDLVRLASDAQDLDVAFILLHGPLGEDGTMQGFLDLLDLPYQGSGVLGSALAMDKHLAKTIYRSAGLPVANWLTLKSPDEKPAAEIIEQLGLPLVIKPVSQGSSLGMTIARSAEEVNKGLVKAFAVDEQVMVEEFIAGREITAGVLGNDTLTALPLVEIIPDEKYDFFDYDAKYKEGGATEICPAPMEKKTETIARRYGIMAHQALQLRGYSRTDMIIDRQDQLYLIETNTIPGMTPTSLLPQAAKAHGLSFSALLDHLIELALEKG